MGPIHLKHLHQGFDFIRRSTKKHAVSRNSEEAVLGQHHLGQSRRVDSEVAEVDL